MNQLFTRLLLLSVVLVGFVMSDLFAQPDGLDAANTDDEPCFAIWDTDDKRGKFLSASGRRYIDIFIPSNFNYTQYQAIVRFYDATGAILPLPGQSNNNGLVQDIVVANLSPNISAQILPDGVIYTYELLTPFAQNQVASLSFGLYGYYLNAWAALQTGGAHTWNAGDVRSRSICWDHHSPRVKEKKINGRISQSSAPVIWAYPNPSSGVLQVLPLESQNTLQLYDLSGALLQTWQLPSADATHKISIQAFPAGMYYLKRQIGEVASYQRIQVL